MGKVVDAKAFAAASAALWHDVHAALAPIIGSGGVAALYKRCLFLGRVEHPWLDGVSKRSLHPGDFAALSEAMLEQSPSDAYAANRALLDSLRRLLISLIGASLTAQLLQTVWDKHGHAVRTHDHDPG